MHQTSNNRNVPYKLSKFLIVGNKKVTRNYTIKFVNTARPIPLPGTNSGTITQDTDITLIPMKKKSFIDIIIFYIFKRLYCNKLNYRYKYTCDYKILNWSSYIVIAKHCYKL